MRMSAISRSDDEETLEWCVGALVCSARLVGIPRYLNSSGLTIAAQRDKGVNEEDFSSQTAPFQTMKAH